jgi:hypothetical protein
VTRRVFALLLSSLAAAMPAATALGADGWRTVQVPAGGFAIDVPRAWVDVTGSADRIVGLLKKYPKLQPYAASLVKNRQLKLLSADATAAGFATNVNVIVVPSQGIRDPRVVAAAGIAQLKGSGLVQGAMSSSSAELPAGTTPVVRYSLAIGGAVTATTQYFLVHGGNAYIVTYTTDPPHARQYEGTFLRSAQSIRFS